MAAALSVAGCAGTPMGARPHAQTAQTTQTAAAQTPLTGYYTDPRYYKILGDQFVIADRRGNGAVSVAPKCEKKARLRQATAWQARQALKAEWAAVRTAPANAPLPSSDADDE